MIFRDSDHSYRLDGVVKSGRVEYGGYSERLRDVESPYLSVTSFLKWFEPFVILVCWGLFYIWEFLEMVTRYSGGCIDGGGLYGGGLWMWSFVGRYLFDTSL